MIVEPFVGITHSKKWMAYIATTIHILLNEGYLYATEETIGSLVEGQQVSQLDIEKLKKLIIKRKFSKIAKKIAKLVHKGYITLAHIETTLVGEYKTFGE